MRTLLSLPVCAFIDSKTCAMRTCAHAHARERGKSHTIIWEVSHNEQECTCRPKHQQMSIGCSDYVLHMDITYGSKSQ